VQRRSSNLNAVFEFASEILDELHRGRPVVLGIVVATDGGPQPLGASMLVRTDGSSLGSISGGCIEATVLARAEEVFATLVPAQDAFDAEGSVWSAALTCGRRVQVMTCVLTPDLDPKILDQWQRAATDEPAALALDIVSGTFLSEGSIALNSALATVAVTGGADVIEECSRRLLVGGVPSQPHFLIYGALDVAEPLAHLARLGGYRVTVCDPRGSFVTAERFGSAHHLVIDQPIRHFLSMVHDARTVVCVLTHDERFDLPILAHVLARGDLAFVGAMGSRTTCERRRQRLADCGLNETQLAALHSPIGLDLGGSTPADTALSIMAEVVAVRNGRSGGQLRRHSGAIHTGISR
jgi:xanthine dehydrogenase accessory factor